MPSVSAHDVARELRSRLGSAGKLKIQKLLYYAQGWSLAWRDDQLFEEPIEAWAQGPVVGIIWTDERHGRTTPAPQDLSGGQLAVIDYVAERYGSFSGAALAAFTHAEDPWRNASEIGGGRSRRNQTITLDAMRAWFRSDSEYRRRAAEVSRLRSRSDIYSFTVAPRTADLEKAVERTLQGEHICESRPA